MNDMDFSTEIDHIFWRNRLSEPVSTGFRLSACGVAEKMPPGLVRHQWNWPHWLLLYFHSPAKVETADGMREAEHSFLLWDPYAMHRYGNEVAEWQHTWFVFSGEKTLNLLEQFQIPYGFPFRYEDERSVVGIANLIYYDLISGREGIDASEFELLELLLSRIRRDLDAGENEISSNIGRAGQYLLEHISGDVSLPVLAEVAGLSVSHFRALFRKFYGVSPSVYLLRQRMQQAIRLLELGGFSCKEVAAQTGFRNQLYFSRVFRNFYGIPPSKINLTMK